MTQSAGLLNSSSFVTHKQESLGEFSTRFYTIDVSHLRVFFLARFRRSPKLITRQNRVCNCARCNCNKSLCDVRLDRSKSSRAVFSSRFAIRSRSRIFGPHLSTTYVDATYCYRRSSVVCRSVGLSVGLSVTIVSPAKTAKAIEIPFGLWTPVGPRNRVLDGVQISLRRGNFEEKGRPIVKHRDSVPRAVQTAEPIEMPFGTWTRVGPRKRVLDGMHIGAI